MKTKKKYVPALSVDSLYTLILFVYFFLIVFFGFVFPRFFPDAYEIFGFSQLHPLGLPLAGLFFGVILLFTVVYKKHAQQINDLSIGVQNTFFSRTIYLLAFSLLCMLIFFLFRNNFLNPDGKAFASKFYHNVFTKGALVTHDEMLEFYVHSRFWFYTHQYFNWTVPFSYQVLSSIAGGVSIFIILKYCKKLLPEKSLALFFIIVSGGYMQLFFGDVENYTITAMFVFMYFYTSHEYIKNRVDIIVPSSILAITMIFHLLGGFLIPSLLFLFYLEYKKGNVKKVYISSGVFMLIILLTLLYFHFHHLPISELFYHSHALGNGGHMLRKLAKPDFYYHMAIINLLFLLVPASLLLLPLLVSRKIKYDAVNSHLGIACISMVGFMFTWRAAIGVYNDWNLFANVAIPVSLFVGYNVLKAENVKSRAYILIPTIMIFILHSYSWIVHNHFYQS